MAAESLVRVAERHNPKRAFVLVSTVLGKHLPVTAPRCRLAGLALGLAVAGDRHVVDALHVGVDHSGHGEGQRVGLGLDGRGVALDCNEPVGAVRQGVGVACLHRVAGVGGERANCRS